MRLTPMRYKDYIWPHNPATYSITYERQVAVHKVPFGRYRGPGDPPACGGLRLPPVLRRLDPHGLGLRNGALRVPLRPGRVLHRAVRPGPDGGDVRRVLLGPGAALLPALRSLRLLPAAVPVPGRGVLLPGNRRLRHGVMEEEKVIQVSVQLPAQALQGLTDMVRQLRRLAAELRGGESGEENTAFDEERFLAMQEAPAARSAQAEAADQTASAARQVQDQLPEAVRAETPDISLEGGRTLDAAVAEASVGELHAHLDDLFLLHQALTSILPAATTVTFSATMEPTLPSSWMALHWQPL